MVMEECREEGYNGTRRHNKVYYNSITLYEYHYRCITLYYNMVLFILQLMTINRILIVHPIAVICTNNVAITNDYQSQRRES